MLLYYLNLFICVYKHISFYSFKSYIYSYILYDDNITFSTPSFTIYNCLLYHKIISINITNTFIIYYIYSKFILKMLL